MISATATIAADTAVIIVTIVVVIFRAPSVPSDLNGQRRKWAFRLLLFHT